MFKVTASEHYCNIKYLKGKKYQTRTTLKAKFLTEFENCKEIVKLGAQNQKQLPYSREKKALVRK